MTNWESIIEQHVTVASFTDYNDCAVPLDGHVDSLSYFTTGDLVELQVLIDAELQRRYDEQRASNEGMPESYDGYYGYY